MTTKKNPTKPQNKTMISNPSTFRATICALAKMF